MKGLLAILAPKGGKAPAKAGAKPPMEPDEEEAEESSGSKYGDILADTLGVAPEDKSAFLDALHGYVRECSEGE